MGITISENSFEQYLDEQGIDARYEELPDGVSKPADYSFEIDGLTVRLEVKEWVLKPDQLPFGSFDPYAPIRKKIEKGRCKFEQYGERGEPCLLVLFESGLMPTLLNECTVVAAMRGDIGERIPLDPVTGMYDMEAAETAFLKGGKMVSRANDGTTTIRNTTISGVAFLRWLDPDQYRFRMEFAKRSSTFKRPLSVREGLKLSWSIVESQGQSHPKLQLTVCDNHDARVPLPLAFPRGPYDVRWGLVGRCMVRTYVGPELAVLEARNAAW